MIALSYCIIHKYANTGNPLCSPYFSILPSPINSLLVVLFVRDLTALPIDEIPVDYTFALFMSVVVGELTV
jgi:hypothetical protein